MKRRNFFRLASTGAAALMVGTSCKPSKHDAIKTESGTGIPQEPPDYRKSIKPVFTNNKGKNAGDKVILALIGAGSWGTNLIIEAAGLNENVSVRYICDVDDTRGGRAIEEVGKIQGFKPFSVRDMRKIFDDKEVDGVMIATPEHWHGLATVWACQAGKDVYVEKCISHSIYEGQKMIEASMKYERVVQCGTMNRSADYGLTARDYIKSGELGDIVTVNAM
jgi:predicted dehydrogenase